MDYNLLQQFHDHYTELFIAGVIPYEIWEKMERKFIENKKLLTINLN